MTYALATINPAYAARLRRFAAEGAKLAILDRAPKSLDTARSQFPDAVVEECDVSSEAEVNRAVK